MKQIFFQGGIAQFSLPSSWVEEYEQDGSGTFFDEKPVSGTLRIKVLEVKKQPTLTHEIKTAFDFIEEIGKKRAIRILSNDVALARSKEKAAEAGKNLSLYFWHIGVKLTTNHFRLIVFTYTILESQEDDTNVRQELDLVNKSISEGRFT
jgi:hypothetical protein